MASIRKRGDKFHVQVRMSGFPARTASFPTARMAQRWAKTVEADMIEGKHFRNVEARRRTLADAITRYIEEEAPKKEDNRVSLLTWWSQQIGHLRLAEVTPAILVEQRGKLARGSYTRAKPESKRSIVSGLAPRYKRSVNTVDRYLSALSHVFTIARKEWAWITYNPFSGVAKIGKSAKRERVLSDEERARLSTETAKDAQLHAFVLCALSTAARAGELVNLTWRDVDLNDGRLLLKATKNSEPRTAWAYGEALRALKEHARVRRFDTDRVFVSKTGKRYGYHKPFVAACSAAQIEGFVFHGLRHSAATYLARIGATEQQLRAIGGWKSGVVRNYVHLAAVDARNVVARMNAKFLAKS